MQLGRRLTPIYAPPEVFDGRPSMHSDQYSLAVMYQELLTGTRPFSGRTIAQLATQHVHNAPNLKPLPASDRPCVAKALEKAPDRRYESCSEFVDRLANPHRRQPAESAGATSIETTAQPVENLPQIDGVSRKTTGTDTAHSLVIALGGTGADCLSQLRQRMGDLGANSPMTLHSVLIDTDATTTAAARSYEPTDVLPDCHTIDIPLRSPNDYRSSGTERLKSISRRWIYNVPRNLNTGGMRPLGRLALVDHGRQVLETLKTAVQELKASLAEGVLPRVYVVGSLTGGTGSGMYIDVVYLLRHLLDESALENAAIVSFLTTNRFQGDPSQPLALHATKSAISEVAHFLKPGNSYPGDSGAGWPSVPAARTPLNDAYIIPQSDRANAPSPIESVVNYLWLDATACHEWFEAGRNDHEEAVSSATTRTMGVIQIGDPGERRSSLLAPGLVKRLLLQWLGNPRNPIEPAKDFAQRVIRRCYLESQPIRRQTERWFASDRQALQELLGEQFEAMDSSVLNDSRQLRNNIIGWLTKSIKPDQHEVLASQIKSQIEREIHLRLQDSRLDLSSTMKGIEVIRAHLRELQQQLIADSDSVAAKQSASAEHETGTQDSQPGPERGTGATGERSPDFRAAHELGESLIELVASRAAASVAKALDGSLGRLIETYTDASARIAQAIQRVGEESDPGSDPWLSAEDALRNRLPEILVGLHDKHVSSHLFRLTQQPGSGTSESLVGDLTCAAAGAIRGVISAETKTTASDSQVRRLAGTSTLDTPSTAVKSTGPHPAAMAADPHASTETIRATQTRDWESIKPMPVLSAASALDAVRPPLLDCGGKQRLYLVCRDKLEKEELLAQLSDSKDLAITTVLAPTTMPLLIHEAQAIELKGVLSWLDALTGDDGKISARLATRCDIDWA